MKKIWSCLSARHICLAVAGGAFATGCGRLALAPPQPTGPGSGAFTSNVMYATGTVTSLSVSGSSAVFAGTATVTGPGAGPGRPFKMRVTAGGPGATVLLTASGLSFHEIVTDGHFDVS